MGPRLVEEELWEGGPLEEPDFGPLDGFAVIGRPRLEKQFVLTTFAGCRHWGYLGWAGLEELIGSAAQRILVSLVAEIVEIAGPESDLLAHYRPVLG